MTFIPVNFDDAQEAVPVGAGKYEVQVTECKTTVTGPNSKVPGSPQFRVSIAFVGDVNAPNITHFISLPNEQDDSKTAQYKLLLLKRFLVAFNVRFDQNGIDTEQMAMDMVGASANIEVSQTEPDAETGNVYNRIILPRLRTEAGR